MKTTHTLAIAALLFAFAALLPLPTAHAEGDGAAKAEKPKAFACEIIQASDASITVKIRSRDKELNGTERVLTLTDKTKFKVDGEKATAADLKPGYRARISAYSVDGDTYTLRSASFLSPEYIKAKQAAAKAKKKVKEEAEAAAGAE